MSRSHVNRIVIRNQAGRQFQKKKKTPTHQKTASNPLVTEKEKKKAKFKSHCKVWELDIGILE